MPPAQTTDHDTPYAPRERGTSNIPTTRMSVIAGCRAGEAHAWDLFFNIYGPTIKRFTRRARLSEQDGDEVLQNVMRSFWQAFRGGFEVNHAVGRFGSYFRTAVNREIMHQRTKSLPSGIPLDDSMPLEDPSLAQSWREIETQERLRQCLEFLHADPEVKARDLLAFERYAIHDEPAETVIRDLGIPSRSRLYAIKHEIIERLRRSLGSLNNDLGEI